jgi:Uma2 family endonuclease
MAVTAPDRIAPRREKRITYPTSDGKPMAETDKHCDLMIYAREALKVYYADRPDVYVSGNNFLYYQEGDPKKRVSPDCYVVFGVDMRQRDSYKAWEEGGKLPDVVFEFTSRKTRKEDTHTKRPLYEEVLKVKEYFLFDPTGDYLKPRLQGYRLVGKRFVSVEPVGGRLYSEQLRLELLQEGENLTLYDPVRGERLLTTMEQARRAEAADRRAEAADRRAREEAAARAAAEAEITRLRAELQSPRRRKS